MVVMANCSSIFMGFFGPCYYISHSDATLKSPTLRRHTVSFKSASCNERPKSVLRYTAMTKAITNT